MCIHESNGTIRTAEQEIGQTNREIRDGKRVAETKRSLDGFFLLARILEECSTIHSPPALFFFFIVEISSRKIISLFMPGSVHSG